MSTDKARARTHVNKKQARTDNKHAPADKSQARSRRIYLLPNLFTTAGLFAAFYAIVSAMRGQYTAAAVAIFIAMLADLFDGRVARMTKTETAFGAEYDSMSDMVSFGVAPALVMYSWGLQYLGKPGWLVAFSYTAAVALRLARFNTKTGTGGGSSRYFEGMPCPTAAGVLAGMIWSLHEYQFNNTFLHISAALLMAALAGLMVSNIPYESFKQINLRSRVPFVAIIAIVLVFIMVSIDPPLVLFIGFLVYAMSGPVTLLLRWMGIIPGRKKK